MAYLRDILYQVIQEGGAENFYNDKSVFPNWENFRKFWGDHDINEENLKKLRDHYNEQIEMGNGNPDVRGKAKFFNEVYNKWVRQHNQPNN